MSVKSATRFLSAVAQDQGMRDRFVAVQSPDEFIQISHQLGYSFTTSELKKVVSRRSRGVVIRRQTGIWPWLRTVNWIDRPVYA
ncbi:MAG: Nif11-like leader peptide family natural product precursor [Alkalinema sp. CACIAM 70d]|nr:MAG: Nif11-like leader peptide family natural product precursor [Alkalinema sp. CACIAM 70d]